MTNEPTPAPAAQNEPALEDTLFKPAAMLAAPGQPPESLLGKRIKAARAHYNLSAEALSRLSKLADTDGRGVSPPSISRYEAGEAMPGARELRLLCDSLEVSPHWLLYGQVPSGVTPFEQGLLDAMRSFVRSMADDADIGGAPTSAHLKFFQQQAREKRLKEVRRPG
jgi:transcriptional regulator with XRE-family HTH domain